MAACLRWALPDGSETLATPAGTETEVEASVAELVDLGRVTSQQSGLVEAGVEHVGAQPHGGRRGCDRGQYRKRCRRAEVIGQMQGIEAEVLIALCLVLQCYS